MAHEWRGAAARCGQTIHVFRVGPKFHPSVLYTGTSAQDDQHESCIGPYYLHTALDLEDAPHRMVLVELRNRK